MPVDHLRGRGRLRGKVVHGLDEFAEHGLVCLHALQAHEHDHGQAHCRELSFKVHTKRGQPLAGTFLLAWELVDTIPSDPVAQDNDKRNNIQIQGVSLQLELFHIWRVSAKLFVFNLFRRIYRCYPEDMKPL